MPSETRHELRRSSSGYRAAFIVGPWVIAAAAGVGALRGNGIPWWVPPLMLLSAPVSLWIFRRMPHEIRTSDDGLTLIASTRTVHIPWEELTGISNPNSHPMWLKWQWTNGSIISHSQLSDRRELLRIAERKARNLRSTPKF